MGNPRTDVSVFKMVNYMFLGNRQEIQIKIVTFCSPNGTFYLNTYLSSFKGTSFSHPEFGVKTCSLFSLAFVRITYEVSSMAS